MSTSLAFFPRAACAALMAFSLLSKVHPSLHNKFSVNSFKDKSKKLSG
jgi:hypothetical protein